MTALVHTLTTLSSAISPSAGHTDADTFLPLTYIVCFKQPQTTEKPRVDKACLFSEIISIILRVDAFTHSVRLYFTLW